MRSVLAEPSLLKGADNTDREQLEKWTKSLLDEFLNIGNFEEALQEITEKFSNNTISTFLENVFEKVKFDSVHLISPVNTSPFLGY